MRSSDLLLSLVATGKADIDAGAILNEGPPPLPDRFDFDRIEGMMLSLAIGDALGNGIEGLDWYRRKSSFGEVRDYVQRPGYPDDRGYPSDDSQMAFWTLEQALRDGRFVPEALLDMFCSREIRGIGATVLQALTKRRCGFGWQECGIHSAGNGALMRIAPILIPHLRTPSPDLWADAALCTLLTHNDSMAIASSIAFVRILWELLSITSVPDPDWWLESMISTLRQLESDESYCARSSALAGFQGPLWKFLEQELPPALRNRPSIATTSKRWYSGAYLLETVPMAIYILMRHADDPEEAIVRAVNDSMDADSVGAIVGAAVGALHGAKKLPQRWIIGLSGRTVGDDDGRMCELLEKARRRWGVDWR